MKLTSMQLEAVVSKIYDAEKSKQDLASKKINAENTKKNLPMAKKYYKLLSQIPLDVRRLMYINKDESEFLSYLNKKSLGEKNKYDGYESDRVSKNDIRQRVVIASIESESLTHLQNKLGIKF